MHAKRHPIRMEYGPAATPTAASPALRARMIGDSGAVRLVGMKVLERAAGHASGPYRVPTIDVGRVAVRTNNPVCGAFRGFGANQAQFAMEGVLDRLAEQVGISGWEIRAAQRDPARRRVGAGPDHGRRLPRRRALPRRGSGPHYDAAVAAGKAVGLGLGLKNSGPRQRLQGDRQGGRALPDGRHGRGAPLLDRDGPGRAHRRPAGRGRGARRRPRPRSRVIVDTTRELGVGQTTGLAGHADGRRLGGRRRAGGPLADGCRPGVDYEGEYRVDWTNRARRRARAPDHPLDLRLRRPAGGHRPRDRRDRARSSPPTTSAGR